MSALYDFLAVHPYLAADIVGLPGVAIAILLGGQHRNTIVLAGLIETLHALPLVWFNGAYWTPQRLGGMSLGIEDLLVCFSLGAGVWFAAIVPWRSRARHAPNWRSGLIRLGAIAAASTPFAVVVHLAGASVMETLLVTMSGTSIVLGLMRPRLLRLSASAIALYPPYYLVVLTLTAALIPNFYDMWDSPELWGSSLLGLPLEEYAFVYAFCLSFPLIVGTVLGTGLSE